MKKLLIGTLMAFSFLIAGDAFAAYDFGPMIGQTNNGEARLADQREAMSNQIAYYDEEGYDITEAESLYATAEESYADLQSGIDEFQGMLEDASDDDLDAPSAELKAKRTELAGMHEMWKSQMHAVYEELSSLDEEV